MTEHVTPWNPTTLPDARGKTFVVTGGNAGIGYFISEQLAGAGATIVLASRSEAKARLAMQAITQTVPDARLEYIPLDLSSLESARSAGDQIGALHRVDGLILNAAALTQKQRKETTDAHEFVFGTNHYGNAQLIAAALPHLADTPGARLVTMGSVAQRMGRIHLDDLEQHHETYRGFRTYGTSKLAQMLFARELDRRLRAANSTTISLIAHPGGAIDGLTPDRAPAFEHTARQRRGAIVMRPFVQGKDHAAWPAVRAALDPAAQGGQLWGPGSATGSRPPRLDPMRGAFTDTRLAQDLWERTTKELGLQLAV
ncbi:SDR family NAD(P)-dependent oxidoreductase [Compostimonas suwonensis]|uniref:NAD(P)-dependent dehydrogenase (Short-subunit alcohol dehydrogenase family) n=1 Tax=Compostimonas suwonensis TaxID=1048394 RepID=A0A2M9BCM4_9MICO|nr:SDR family NAD(P)-dependent oxidoreductase [Compostimonas suwonensis]PJJ55699.1 NAD(P)-dependent dehydrogenase (short-subunit alcohol dehydrogenase family) [Compostimonas suwonensis]